MSIISPFTSWLRKIFKRWFRVGDRWQNLHGFFQVSGAKFFIAWFALTPAIAKILEQLPNPLFFALEAGGISISLDLPFNWILLWAASFLYAIGFVLFHFRCPAFIKKHPTFTVYKSIGHSPRWLVAEAEMAWSELSTNPKASFAARLIEKKFAVHVERPIGVPEGADNTAREVFKDYTEWCFEYENNWYSLKIGEALISSKEKDLFWEVFAPHSEDRMWERYFIWTLAFLACLLTFYVVCENVLFVLRYLSA